MSSVELVKPTYSDCVFIARRMRALDAEEILPLTRTGKPEDTAMWAAHLGGYGYVALLDGKPVTAFGVYENMPTVWCVWMFATDDWPRVALTVTKTIRREWMPLLQTSDYSRVDCWSMEGHDVAHRWLESLGASREATLKDYGPTGKAFHCYSWTRSGAMR